MSYVPIYDVFTGVTAAVKTAMSLSVLHYEYGHPIEIINTLTRMSQDKYPMVCLFLDTDETMGRDAAMQSEYQNIHLIIANSTLKDYTASQRATLVFKPILYPIYFQLLSSIAGSGYFMTQGADRIEHTKTDRFFWGKNGLYASHGNVFNDHLDAIEISNMKLKQFKTC